VTENSNRRLGMSGEKNLNPMASLRTAFVSIILVCT
jgi:hypothetical protein